MQRSLDEFQQCLVNNQYHQFRQSVTLPRPKLQIAAILLTRSFKKKFIDKATL